MPDSARQANSRPLLRMLAWPLLIGFFLLSLVFILQWLLSLELEEGFFEALSYRWVAAAVIVQMLVALVMIVSWCINLRLHGVVHATVHQSTIMIGLNSIGKYMPGKLLGVAARGAALYKLSGNGGLALQATLVEQIASIHCCAAAALLAWLMNTGRYPAAVLSLLLMLVSVVLVSRSGDLLLAVMARIVRKRELAASVGPGFRKSYAIIFMTMAIVWGLSALALHFCVAAYDSQHVPGFWRLLQIIASAYLSGFLAFFTLAGLGAREGVMLVMLSIHMKTSVAAYISILHRLITLLIDVLLGIYTLSYGKHLIASNGGPGNGKTA